MIELAILFCVLLAGNAIAQHYQLREVSAQRDDYRKWMRFWQDHVRANEKIMRAQQERIALQQNAVLFLANMDAANVTKVEMEVTYARPPKDYQ